MNRQLYQRMNISGSKKVCVTLARERRQLKPVLYILTILTCCVLLWDPTILDPVFFAIFPSPAAPSARNMDTVKDSHNYFLAPRATGPPPRKLFDLPFIPKDHFCEELFEKSDFSFNYSEIFWDHADAYKLFLIEIGMLEDGNADETTWIYHELAKTPTVRTICDVGFGAAHKAFYCLAARDDITLHSFEDRNTSYSRDMEIFMSTEFPFQFVAHMGDFKTQIPEFLREYNSTKCDMVLLDSALSKSKIEYVLETLEKAINRHQNIVILDAHPRQSRRESLVVWEDAKKRKKIEENFRCSFRSDDGDSLRRPGVTGLLLGHIVLE